MKLGQAHRPEKPAPVPATEAQPVVKVDMETENTQSQPPAPDIDVTVPNIPMPEQVQSAEIKDTFDAGFKFAFIGSGQGGSSIAQTFYKLGYRRVCAVNTAEQDLAHIGLPAASKWCFGDGGAGKDPAKAGKLIAEKKEDALDFMRRSFGPGFDRVIICAGAGGGTGAGTAVHLIDAAIELQKALHCPTEQVGVILALPKLSEGQRVSLNAHNVLTALWTLVDKGLVSPLILLDNERIGSLYPSLAVDPFWDTANASVCSLFHLFNSITVSSSHYSTFDRNDLKTVLDSGLITFGATPVAKWGDATDISYAVRSNLKSNILSGGVDIGTGTVAGVVVIGGAAVLNGIPQTHLDHAFDQMNRLLRQPSVVHRGIYRGNQNNLVVYTTIGGLAQPTAKLNELKRVAGLP